MALKVELMSRQLAWVVLHSPQHIRCWITLHNTTWSNTHNYSCNLYGKNFPGLQEKWFWLWRLIFKTVLRASTSYPHHFVEVKNNGEGKGKYWTSVFSECMHCWKTHQRKKWMFNLIPFSALKELPGNRPQQSAHRYLFNLYVIKKHSSWFSALCSYKLEKLLIKISASILLKVG